jgi:hypothetical protein
MEYRKSVSFHGDPDKALETAQSTFIQLGYRIEKKSQRTLRAVHPGGMIRSGSGAPIFGASPITVSADNNHLVINAEFGGVQQMRRFITRLMVGLAVFLGLGLGITFALTFEDRWPLYLALGLGVGMPLIELPIFHVTILKIVRKRAEQALDTLCENIVTVSQ